MYPQFYYGQPFVDRIDFITSFLSNCFVESSVSQQQKLQATN